jgi:hypothetical protein
LADGIAAEYDAQGRLAGIEVLVRSSDWVTLLFSSKWSWATSLWVDRRPNKITAEAAEKNEAK